MTRIILDFNKGIAKQDVAVIPNELLKGASEAVLEAAHLMAGLAKVHVRVDTGSLRDSIRVERGGEGLHWAQVRVRAGGFVTNPRTGKLVDYAAIVEVKYPYMRRAWEEVRPQVETIIRRICDERLSKIPGVEVAH